MSKKTNPTSPIPPPEIAAKLEALRAANAQAAQDLAAYFGAERWAKLIIKAQRQGMDAASIESLCGKMISTRREHHPRNAQAALIGAANGFICAIGGSPTAEDVSAFESALAASAV
jgi:hypothetical protein